jgi:hypothetical protein
MIYYEGTWRYGLILVGEAICTGGSILVGGAICTGVSIRDATMRSISMRSICYVEPAVEARERATGRTITS